MVSTIGQDLACVQVPIGRNLQWWKLQSNVVGRRPPKVLDYQIHIAPHFVTVYVHNDIGLCSSFTRLAGFQNLAACKPCRGARDEDNHHCGACRDARA
jgi:hypothetical protein